MITRWQLPCLLFGNFCYLLCAMEIQVNQSGLKLVCFGNTLLLCTSDVTQRDCIDTSLCKIKEERQRNETTQDLWNQLSSNCSFNNRNSRSHILDHQNTTDILKLADCWSRNMKSANYSQELICSGVVFLSIMIMFLSYLCLKTTLTQYLKRRQMALLYVKSNQRSNVELL